MDNHIENVINRIISKLNNIDDQELKILFFELIQERNELSTKMYIDELSKLYNRKILTHIRNVSAVVMLDIDDFKLVNDTLGHHTGDYVIQEISKIILNNIRSSDIACRYGGDEILITFSNCSEKIVEERIKKIQDEVRNKIKIPNIKITLSIGIAMNYDNEAIDFLINKADKAMYNSKQNGKNTITKYTDSKKYQ